MELEDEQARLAGRNEYGMGEGASLFTATGPELAGTPMGEHECFVFNELRQDEAMQLDELIERLEPRMVSGEIFTALFELELAGRVKQMPGKNYVRSF